MRADIAASLLHNPKSSLFRWTGSGLDVSVKDSIRRAITQINQEEETTILLTTHDLSDIEQLCDQFLWLIRGKKIFDGTVSQLKDLWKDEDSPLTRRQVKNHLLSHYEGLPDMSIDEQEISQYWIRWFRYQSSILSSKPYVIFWGSWFEDGRYGYWEDIIRRFYRKEL